MDQTELIETLKKMREHWHKEWDNCWKGNYQVFGSGIESDAQYYLGKKSAIEDVLHLLEKE